MDFSHITQPQYLQIKPTSLPTQKSALDRKQQRIVKNRANAIDSRTKKRDELDGLRTRVAHYETENILLKARVEHLERTNAKLNDENTRLSGMARITHSGYFSTLIPARELDESEVLFQKMWDPLGFNNVIHSTTAPIFSMFVVALIIAILPFTTSSSQFPFHKTAYPISHFDFHAFKTLGYSQNTSTELSLKSDIFMADIQLVASIDPPNAVLAIASLFDNDQDDDNDIYSTVATTYKYKREKVCGESPLFHGPPFILLNPAIKIVPWKRPSSDYDSAIKFDSSSDMKLTILASGPSLFTQSEGMLRLDVKVFAATWLT